MKKTIENEAKTKALIQSMTPKSVVSSKTWNQCNPSTDLFYMKDKAIKAAAKHREATQATF